MTKTQRTPSQLPPKTPQERPVTKADFPPGSPLHATVELLAALTLAVRADSPREGHSDDHLSTLVEEAEAHCALMLGVHSFSEAVQILGALPGAGETAANPDA